MRTDYGARFADQVFLSSVRVPRLADLLDLEQDPRHGDVHFLLELKSDPAMRDDPGPRRPSSRRSRLRSWRSG